MAWTDDNLRRRFDEATRPVRVPDVARIHARRRHHDLRRRAGHAALSVAVVGLSVLGFVWLRDAFDQGAGGPATVVPTPRENGLIVFTGGSEHLFTIRADGTGMRQLTRGGGEDVLDLDADWSPDGQHVVFVRWDYPTLRLFDVDVETGDMRPITPPESDVRRPAWSPDGEWIAFSGVGKAPMSGVFLVRSDGSDLHRVTDDRFHAPSNAVWSPDGSTIAFTSNLTDGDGGYEEGWDVYLVDPDGSNLRNLTNTPDPAQSESPIGWLPNGNLLITTEPDPVVDATGAWLEVTTEGEVVRTVFEYETGGRSRAQAPSFSPDGRFVVFDSGRGGGPEQIWTFELATGDLARVTTDGGYLPDWGPMPAGDTSAIASATPPTPEGETAGRDIGLPFTLCDVTSVRFTLESEPRGTAWLGRRAGSGGCDATPDTWNGVLAVDVDGDGVADGWNEKSVPCGLACAVVAGSDLDGGGSDELVVRTDGPPVSSFRLYEVDRAGGVRPITVAGRGAPAHDGFAGDEPAVLRTGGDEGASYRIACREEEGSRIYTATWSQETAFDSPDTTYRVRTTTFSFVDDLIHVLDSTDQEQTHAPLPDASALCDAALEDGLPAR